MVDLIRYVLPALDLDGPAHPIGALVEITVLAEVQGPEQLVEVTRHGLPPQHYVALPLRVQDWKGPTRA